MMREFADGSHFTEISASESFHKSEVQTQKDIPSINELFDKLKDIFPQKVDETSVRKKEVPDLISSVQDLPRSITLADGTVVDLPISSKNDLCATKRDSNGIVYFKDGAFEPETNYELNGNQYSTDSFGNIVICKDKPHRTPENQRDILAQLEAGGEDRHSQDQGGHIVGRDLGGDSGIGNLIAMDSRINQSDYKRMENDVKKFTDLGQNISRTTEISYPEGSKRPDIITTTIDIEDRKFVYRFDNNLDGALFSDLPENGRDVVNSVLEDTNGQISSIKKEYDRAGNCLETSVYVTYTDETGSNFRRKISIDGE